MVTALFILFVLSILAPLYTYAVYPFALRLFPKKEYAAASGVFIPNVSVVLLTDNADVERKLDQLRLQDYPEDHLELFVAQSVAEVNACVSNAKGDIVLFTDTDTDLDKKAITNLICRFADESIRRCCVTAYRRCITAT